MTSAPAPRRLKVLLSAYACAPGRGSEPGVGWHLSTALAHHHDVWVLTREENRRAIQAELAQRPVAGLHHIFTDLPRWARWWNRDGRGVQVHYYLWQLGAISTARRAHSAVGFDVAQHVTYVRYWAPAAAAFLGLPFVWGPVGGGESMPRPFLRELAPSGRRFEYVRDAARWAGEHDPFVRMTARRARIAFATTPESAARMRRLTRVEVRHLSEAALSDDEIDGARSGPDPARNGTTFLSIGRLLAWKGTNLGLRAFATANLSESTFVIIGEGPERGRLEALARELGIADRVEFVGQVPREETLARLSRASALVHPSLHDSGGWVALEAMAAGKPVICLALGGPAVQVPPECGFIVPAVDPAQAVQSLAEAMRSVHESPHLAEQMGKAGRAHVARAYTWRGKAVLLAEVLARTARGQSMATRVET